jgi:hypothetical protein
MKAIPLLVLFSIDDWNRQIQGILAHVSLVADRHSTQVYRIAPASGSSCRDWLHGLAHVPKQDGTGAHGGGDLFVEDRSL